MVFTEVKNMIEQQFIVDNYFYLIVILIVVFALVTYISNFANKKIKIDLKASITINGQGEDTHEIAQQQNIPPNIPQNNQEDILTENPAENCPPCPLITPKQEIRSPKRQRIPPSRFIYENYY